MIRLKNKSLRCLLLSLLLASGMAGAESGVLSKDSVLHDQPYADATIIGYPKLQTPVTIISRQGAWIQITTSNGTSGWIRIFDVATVASSKAGQSGAKQPAPAAKTGSGGDTINTGASEGDMLDKAQPNMAEDAKLGQ